MIRYINRRFKISTSSQLRATFLFQIYLYRALENILLPIILLKKIKKLFALCHSRICISAFLLRESRFQKQINRNNNKNTKF